MAKQETNFIEVLLRQTMIGMTIYDDDGIAHLIQEINYHPTIRQVYIETPEGNFKLPIDKNFDFDYNQLKKVVPNKHKIMGKFKR